MTGHDSVLTPEDELIHFSMPFLSLLIEHRTDTYVDNDFLMI